MNKPPAFQFYPRDFLADTTHLTAQEVGAYWRLVSLAWVGIKGCKPGTLPNSPDRLARMAGVSIEEWAAVSDAVTELFTDDGNGLLVHNRLMKEREKQTRYHKKQSDAGKKGAATRWHKKKQGNNIDGVAIVSPMAKNSSASASASSSTTTNQDQKHMCRAILQTCNEITNRNLSPTEQRMAKVRARLKTYTPQQLEDAMRGAYGQPFFRGENENGRRYDDPITVFKNDTAVETHLDHWKRLKNGDATPRNLSPKQRRMIDNSRALAAVKLPSVEGG